jgi:hypothetical protein
MQSHEASGGSPHTQKTRSAVRPTAQYSTGSTVELRYKLLDYILCSESNSLSHRTQQ